MQDDLEIKMSMLIDDELNSEEALEVLSQIRNDPQLREKWNRYKSMSYSLRHDSVVLPKPSFFDSVSQALEREVTTIGPVIAKESRGKKLPAIMMALAASIAGVAIFSWSNFASNLENPLQQTVASKVSATPTKLPKVQLANSPAVPSRLNDYLITHDESIYSAGSQTMLPYARVVSYSSSN